MGHSSKKLGRSVLYAVAGATAIGGFAADWNRTHLFNPSWPPHAKFHDALTISVGALLGGGGIYFLRRSGNNLNNRSSRKDRDRDLDLALGAALPAVFWASQGLAFAYPGTRGLEAEFPQYVPRIGGVWINERFASGLMLALAAGGYAATRRTDRDED